jgi:alcohol dehydrogenase class IV
MAFVDPVFPVAFPPAVTLNNGIDALCHCIEAYTSRTHHPLAATLALEGARIVRNALPEVLADPENLVWRRKMSYAALLGGLVSAQSGIGLVHQMGAYLTLDLGFAHGAANGAVLLAVLKHVLSALGARNGLLAQSLGTDLREMGSGRAAEEVLRGVKEFFRRTGFRAPIEKDRISEETLTRFAEGTFRSQQYSWCGWDELALGEIKSVFRNAVFPEEEASF